ncbi:MAG: ABC transporter ATP-binding protein [Desulfovibrio sp.]|jgi:ABC-type lipoprotein export system ATPase subunit|nr:ABC transporter ATP-binding protein [Desulfovibrio sp.]
MAPVIIAKDLHKCYAGFDPVLRGVSMEVESGEMVAVMGPSGCGKSTMLHILGMLHAPDLGLLEILGTDVLTLDREQVAAFRRSNMGFVMQSSNLFEHSTVFENVEFPLIYEGVPPQERWERVIRALDLVRLSARVHYRSNRLSGGEQQRAAIARAMVNTPRILLADEPTGALDSATSRLIMENFRVLCHSGGVAAVMVTHDPKMAEFCDSIYTLEEGILRCQRRELTAVAVDSRARGTRARGALVTERFPDDAAQGVMDEVTAMYETEMLSRVYAIRGNSFSEYSQDYTLSLAVRTIGIWQFFVGAVRCLRQTRGQLNFLRRARAYGFRSLWRSFCAFAKGMVVAKWGKEDAVAYFYATNARDQAAACYVAAQLLRVPFAFALNASDLNASDMECPDGSLSAKISSALFVRCDSEATQLALRTRFLDTPPEKFLYFRAVSKLVAHMRKLFFSA